MIENEIGGGSLGERAQNNNNNNNNNENLLCASVHQKDADSANVSLFWELSV